MGTWLVEAFQTGLNLHLQAHRRVYEYNGPARDCTVAALARADRGACGPGRAWLSVYRARPVRARPRARSGAGHELLRQLGSASKRQGVHEQHGLALARLAAQRRGGARQWQGGQLEYAQDGCRAGGGSEWGPRQPNTRARTTPRSLMRTGAAALVQRRPGGWKQGSRSTRGVRIASPR
jgi:hypothetical protein